ncbi:hypothetical protein SAMN05428975_2812 [Mucilaginibacter sp. OK268]|uniref:hypothetical protein n=1 Tax=Mucilaginibacter sp. OK268 TaxID=1881048 RepID=UPI00088257B9|nr:hypothetical protein [Mucilaginibacter sp. OK268]SDP79609.1 hypothetical protein SAMN05428975_2812 [Mucilaginibacter sp. OK268]
MKKTQLLMLLLLSAICIQSCKKDVTTSASTISDKILSANINSVAWNPDSVSAAITYNAAAKTKTFTVVGTATQQRVSISVAVPNSTNTAGFPFATYKVDATNNVQLAYYTQTLIGGDFNQVGIVEPGSGSVTTTAIDSVKKVITGTYSFTSKQVNTDDEGNIISINVQQILSGTFTNLPYTFVSK